MERRRFGSTGKDVPIIGQGTWYIDSGRREAAIAALRAGLDHGMTHIDTAELYGSGAAEALVGEAMAGRRDEVFLVSKVMPNHATRNGTIKACEQSLSHLKTDRLDCYLLHWPGQHPLQQTIEAFEQLQSQGKILSWGVSNFDVTELEQATHLSRNGGPVCNQVLYHLQERAIEHAVLPWCETHGVAVVGYSPFGHDSFPSARSTGGRVLQQIADAHDATPRQIALSFLARRSSLFTIPKASSPAHATENAKAGDLALSAAELASIDAAFPLGPRPRALPMI
ncbi:MAG: aldo/keto reductase [Betaproteobacteria bacterium]